MKKKLIIILASLFTLAAAWMWFAPRIRVDLAAWRHDPSAMSLGNSPLIHKSWAHLPEGIEIGLIHLKDRGTVKYWFISRHEQPGIGITRFDFPDGTTAYLRGYFCCEVQMPDEAVGDKQALLAFIGRSNRIHP